MLRSVASSSAAAQDLREYFICSGFKLIIRSVKEAVNVKAKFVSEHLICTVITELVTA